MAGSEVVTPSRPASRRSRRARRLGPMIGVSLGLLLVGWSALWLFARHEATVGFDGWLAAEREQGRVWTCPGRRIGGFPLSIVVRCDHPTLTDGADEGAIHGELAALTARAHLYFPTNVLIALTGPMTVAERTTGTDLRLTWTRAHLTLRGDVPGDLDRGQLELDGLAVAPVDGSTPTTIGHVELGFKPLPQAPQGPLDAELVLKVGEARSPDADAVFGSAAPIATEAVAVLGKLPGGKANLPQWLEAWRTAGGDLALKSFRFAKGSFVAGGEGRITLDDEHRIAGRLDARFSGLEPVAARFGIPIGAVKMGGLLAGLLGGGKAAPEAAELALPLTARNGRLSVGPVKTGVALVPLY